MEENKVYEEEMIEEMTKEDETGEETVTVGEESTEVMDTAEVKEEPAAETTRTSFADSFMKFSKKAASAIGKGIDVTAARLSDTKEEMDRMRYAPVMAEDFTAAGFVMPKMLRTIEDDHQNVDVCQGAVAFTPVYGRNKVLEMTVEKMEKLGVSLEPYSDGVFYLKDPYSLRNYVVIDEFFETMRQAKIKEVIEAVAHSGAKAVEVSLRKEKKSFAFLRSDETDRNEAGKEAYDGTSETDSIFLGVVASETFTEPETGELELRYLDKCPDFTEFLEKLGDKNDLEYAFASGCDLDEDSATDIDLALEKLGLNTANSLRREIDEEKRYYIWIKVTF